MLVYLRVDEILDSSRLLWTSVALVRSEAEVAYGSSCSFSVPFFVSGHRVLLVSDGEAVSAADGARWAAPGAPGLLAWPRSRVKPAVA